MTAPIVRWSDPRVTCDVCRDRPAVWVAECWEGFLGGDLDRHYFLACERTYCLGWVDTTAELQGIHTDTRALTCDEAEWITGLDLRTVA